MRGSLLHENAGKRHQRTCNEGIRHYCGTCPQSFSPKASRDQHEICFYARFVSFEVSCAAGGVIGGWVFVKVVLAVGFAVGWVTDVRRVAV